MVAGNVLNRGEQRLIGIETGNKWRGRKDDSAFAIPAPGDPLFAGAIGAAQGDTFVRATGRLSFETFLDSSVFVVESL
jgi:hypothetical protein